MAELTLNPEENVYPVPESLLLPLAVSAPHSLRRCTVGDLDKECEWESKHGSRLNVREWCPIGNDKLLIHPRPLTDTAASVEGLIVHEPVLDNGVSVMPIRPEYVQCIEDWCVERAAFKEGGQLLATYRNQYEQFLSIAQRIRGISIIKLKPQLPQGVVGEGGLKEGTEDWNGNA